MQNFNTNNRNCTFTELDEQISHEEILNAIHSLKNNKSCRVDNILNEHFHKAADILIAEPFYISFNKILDSISFPATGLIVPLYKKGSFDDTNNYRGITYISCFVKLFTTILNNRLKKWGRNHSGGNGIGGEMTRVWGTKQPRVKIEAKSSPK